MPEQPDDLVTALAETVALCLPTWPPTVSLPVAKRIAHAVLASGLVLPAADVIPRAEYERVKEQAAVLRLKRAIFDQTNEDDFQRIRAEKWQERWKLACEELLRVQAELQKLTADVIPKLAVLDVMAEHGDSETPGRCCCGFWMVLGTEDHLRAMLDALVAWGES